MQHTLHRKIAFEDPTTVNLMLVSYALEPCLRLDRPLFSLQASRTFVCGRHGDLRKHSFSQAKADFEECILQPSNIFTFTLTFTF